MREYGSQAVVWQTAMNPVAALELLARASGRGRACSARRPSPPQPFLAKLEQLGSPHGVLELDPVIAQLEDLRGRCR